MTDTAKIYHTKTVRDTQRLFAKSGCEFNDAVTCLLGNLLERIEELESKGEHQCSKQQPQSPATSVTDPPRSARKVSTG